NDAEHLGGLSGGNPAATVYWNGPDGSLDTYTEIGTGNTYTSPTGVYNVLIWSPTESNYQLTTVYQNVYRFGTNGKLQSITDPSGQAVTFTYSGPGGRLSAVTDANPTSGNRRSLAIGYDASNRISTITDPLGRVGTLVYDATTGDLTQVKL